MKGSFKAFDYCERIHPEGAEVLAVYKKDFYAGEPAVTVNSFGKGKAYYIAARTADKFLAEISSAIIRDFKIETILPVPLPEGVTARMRTDGKRKFIFIFNFKLRTPRIRPASAGLIGKSQSIIEWSSQL